MREVGDAAFNMLKSVKSMQIDQYCILLAKLVIEVNKHCDVYSIERFVIHESEDLHTVNVCINKFTAAISLCLYQIMTTDDIEKIKILTYEIHKILRFNSNEIVGLLEKNTSGTKELREVCLDGFNK